MEAEEEWVVKAGQISEEQCLIHEFAMHSAIVAAEVESKSSKSNLALEAVSLGSMRLAEETSLPNLGPRSL